MSVLITVSSFFSCGKWVFEGEMCRRPLILPEYLIIAVNKYGEGSPSNMVIVIL